MMRRASVITVWTLFAMMVSVLKPAESMRKSRAAALDTARVFKELNPVSESLNIAAETAAQRAFKAHKSVVTKSASWQWQMQVKEQES